MIDKFPRIGILPVKHPDQDYPTAGNYGETEDGWWMEVSELQDWRYSALVAVHELVEMILTKNNGVSWEVITDFDTVGEGAGSDDPGMLPQAPYHTEHLQALQIEQLLAKMLGVDWCKYNEELDALEYRPCL